MERRVLIAVFLSFLVLYGYQALFVPPPQPPPEAPAGAETPAGSQPVAAAPPPAPAAAPPAPELPPVAVVVGDSAEREIIVDTATAQATLTNRGGRVTH